MQTRDVGGSRWAEAVRERPARVLLVCGPAAGGMRRHLDALLSGLPSRDFDVGLAAPFAAIAPPQQAPTETVGGLPPRQFVIDLGDRPRPAADLRAWRSLHAALRTWRPEVIHAHGVKAALLTLLQPLTGENSPVVVTFHNLWQGGALTLPLRLLMRRAAAGVAVSEAVRLRLEHSGIRPSMLTVIPNGVDLEAFSPSPVPPQSRPFTISFLGRLTEEKGVPELLSLVDRWPASVPARFLIAGDGPLRRAVSEAARAGSPICFLGHQQDPRVVYRQTDVVVMPSHSEGHPITALETMASGLPLVATQVGGLAEIIVAGETGLLVPPGNPAALLEALLGLASNRQRREAMGAAGRCRAEVEFGLTRMLDRLEALYRRVLPPSRAPRPES